MQEITLRLISPGEADAFIELALQAWDDREAGRERITAEAQAFFESRTLETGLCYALIRDRRIVGTAFMIERQHDLNGVDIYNIAILPELRGEGNGKLMMDLLCDAAGKHGKDWVFISTNARISQFYLSCGFTEFGRIPRATRTGEDRVYLCKDLTGSRNP